MVGRIDAAAGVYVFIPGAADGIVLLDDDEGDAGLPQLNGGIETGHAGPDNDDIGALQRGGVQRQSPFQAARWQAVVGQVLAHHRDIVVGHRFACGDRHHLAQQRVVGPPRHGPASAGPLRQRVAQSVADRCPQRFRHEFLVVHRPTDEGFGGFQPMPFARELYQRQQQRRGIGRFERAAQLGVFRRSSVVRNPASFHIRGSDSGRLCSDEAKTQSVCVTLTFQGLARQMHTS